MSDDHHARADDLPHGTFAEGQADPTRYRDDNRSGHFSDGEAQPVADEEAVASAKGSRSSAAQITRSTSRARSPTQSADVAPGRLRRCGRRCSVIVLAGVAALVVAPSH